jgi:hypothetical protein
MTDRDALIAASHELAAAIGRRDLAAISGFLAPGFVHRSPGGPASEIDAFLDGIRQIPGDIVFVTLEQLEVDLAPAGAIVTGVQHAQVKIGADVVDDRRAFVDWFVRHEGRWLIQVAVDLPA